MRRARTVLVLALWIVPAAFAAALPGDDTPRAPKLEPPAGAPPAPPAGDAEPAHAVPRTVAVCTSAASRRCWTAASDAACAGEPGGGVFRVVIGDAGGTDAQAALAQCRALYAPQ